MRFIKIKFVAVVLLVAIAAGFYQPKPVKAIFGIGDVSFDFSTQIANPYDMAKDVGKAAITRIATNYANEFLNRFIDKVMSKYKIRNYLYYNRLLTSHYLNQWIADKIDDPDLRDAFQGASQLYSYDFTGRTTAAQKRAALQRIKDAQAKYYISNGGIDPAKIYNPPAGMSDREYFAMVRAYYANPKAFSDQQLNEQFAAIQASAAAASSQEIAAGQGLKASRELVTVTGGSPGLTKTLSIINNPSGFIKDHIQEAISSIFRTNTDVANNPYAIIGSALGNFVFKRLQLNSNDSSDVINEYDEPEFGYDPDDGSAPTYAEIDLDQDGIPDGRDTNNDGVLNSVLDVCYHGGTPINPPGCSPSSTAGSSQYFTPFCQAIDKAKKDVSAFANFANSHRNQVDGDNFKNDADVTTWSRRAQVAYSSLANLIGTVQDFNNPNFDNTEIALGRYADYLNAINMSLLQDKDLELDGRYGSYDGVDKIVQYTNDVVNYLTNLRNAIGRCDNPNTAAAAGVPVPPGIPANGNGNGSGDGEICGDGIDNDGDGNIDEGCPPPNICDLGPSDQCPYYDLCPPGQDPTDGSECSNTLTIPVNTPIRISIWINTGTGWSQYPFTEEAYQNFSVCNDNPPCYGGYAVYANNVRWDVMLVNSQTYGSAGVPVSIREGGSGTDLYLRPQ